MIVDDHLARGVLGGMRSRRWGDEVPVLTWGLHFRLLRALMDSRTFGRLSSSARDNTLAAAMVPPSNVLQILDPRPYTTRAVQLKIDYGLSIVAAELLAAALETGSSLHVVAGNVGRSWDRILAGSAVAMFVYDSQDIP